MTQLTIDVWSDIACPWCYVGKRRLEGALARFPHADSVALRWRAFELDPSAPRVFDAKVPLKERLAKKYRTTPAGAQQMIDRMRDTAAEDGIEMRFDVAQPTNTFDAHRLLVWAHTHGAQDALKERLFAAYLTEGALISDPDVLAARAADVGLDADEASRVLATDEFAAEVREDEGQARALGITGVPFFVLGSRYGVSGAQPVEVLAEVLEKAWDDPEARPPVIEGEACGVDGCAPEASAPEASAPEASAARVGS